MKVSVSVSGVQALRKRVGLFRERMGNLRPAFARAAIEVLDDAQQQFNDGGDPPWAPKKHPNGLPLLVRKGTLKQSLQADAIGAVDDITGGVRVGTNVAYAPFQQKGTATIPARPFLWRDDDALKQKIRQVFVAYIAGTL